MKTITMIATHRGGVGKTTLALLISDLMTAKAAGHLDGAVERELSNGAKRGGDEIAALERLVHVVEQAAREIEVYDVDVPKDGMVRSALQRRYPNAEGYRVAPSLDEIRADPFAADKHFDVLTQSILEGNSVVDLGAGVVGPWLEYAERGRVTRLLAREGYRVDFVTVTTSDRAAIALAADALEGASDLFTGYDGLDFHPYVALNAMVNDFAGLAGTAEWARLAGMTGVGVTLPRGGGVASVRMARGSSEMFGRFEASELRPTRIAAMTVEEVQDLFKVTAMEAARGRGDYMIWLWRMAEQLYAAGLVGDGVVRETEYAGPVDEATASAVGVGVVRRSRSRNK